MRTTANRFVRIRIVYSIRDILFLLRAKFVAPKLNRQHLLLSATSRPRGVPNFLATNFRLLMRYKPHSAQMTKQSPERAHRGRRRIHVSAPKSPGNCVNSRPLRLHYIATDDRAMMSECRRPGTRIIRGRLAANMGYLSVCSVAFHNACCVDGG